MLDWFWVFVSVSIILASIPGLVLAPDLWIALLVFFGLFMWLGIARILYEMAVRVLRIDETQGEILRSQRRTETSISGVEEQPSSAKKRPSQVAMLEALLYEDNSAGSR